jgi:hypothetical protein
MPDSVAVGAPVVQSGSFERSSMDTRGSSDSAHTVSLSSGIPSVGPTECALDDGWSASTWEALLQ